MHRRVALATPAALCGVVDGAVVVDGTVDPVVLRRGVREVRVAEEAIAQAVQEVRVQGRGHKVALLEGPHAAEGICHQSSAIHSTPIIPRTGALRCLRVAGVLEGAGLHVVNARPGREADMRPKGAVEPVELALQLRVGQVALGAALYHVENHGRELDALHGVVGQTPTAVTSRWPWGNASRRTSSGCLSSVPQLNWVLSNSFASARLRLPWRMECAPASLAEASQRAAEAAQKEALRGLIGARGSSAVGWPELAGPRADENSVSFEFRGRMLGRVEDHVIWQGENPRVHRGACRRRQMESERDWRKQEKDIEDNQTQANG
eukprot:scaffold664_cov260-Pinguiococcus_pyrenoidosus.AAC.11